MVFAYGKCPKGSYLMRHTEPICVRYQQAADLISKRWTALILKALMGGPMRFNEMAECLDSISDRVLSERLKELEHEQIIVRHVLPETPVHVEYALTAKGQSLSPIIDAIETWSQTWIPLPVAEPINASTCDGHAE